MLLGSSKRVDEMIVALLGSRVGASAAWLHQEVNNDMRSCSLQGIYHELRKLQREGVVIKVKGQYHLSISWASSLMEFADSVYENCVGAAPATEILPLEGESRSWQFTNLLRLDDFWMQVMQLLYTETRSPSLFAWQPFPWFYFAQPDKVERFYDFVKRERRRLYYILAEDNFLSRTYAEGVAEEILEFSFTDPPFSVREDTHLVCVAPYLLKVKLDSRTSEKIESLFSSITCVEEMNYQRISGVLNQPAKVKIQIWHDEKKANRLQKKFINFFGVP